MVGGKQEQESRQPGGQTSSFPPNALYEMAAKLVEKYIEKE